MKKRSLSEFMCMEMLYDYKSGKLDSLRTQAVEECLLHSPRVRDELKKLSLGMGYCEKLKEIKVSVPMAEAILSQPKPTQKLLGKLKISSWPQPVKWGMEAIVVAIAIALFVTQLPELFKSGNSQNSVVVRHFETETVADQIEPHKEINTEPESPESLKVNPPTSAVTLTKNELAVQKTHQKEIASSVPLVLRPPEPAPLPTAATTTPTPGTMTAASKITPSLNPETSVKAASATDASAKTKRQGYVYRLVMFVDNVDGTTPQIVKLLQSNGGEKAGEVELGWRRKGGSYFHFTLPQQNYAVVVESLKKYSDFNIVKSAHPRVMPEGVERFILWVEEKKQN